MQQLPPAIVIPQEQASPEEAAILERTRAALAARKDSPDAERLRAQTKARVAPRGGGSDPQSAASWLTARVGDPTGLYGRP